MVAAVAKRWFNHTGRDCYRYFALFCAQRCAVGCVLYPYQRLFIFSHFSRRSIRHRCARHFLHAAILSSNFARHRHNMGVDWLPVACAANQKLGAAHSSAVHQRFLLSHSDDAGRWMLHDWAKILALLKALQQIVSKRKVNSAILQAVA